MRVKGYTLIEILVVLTVIGILFGVGYASYRDFSRRQAITGISKLVLGDLRKAQQSALSGQKPANVVCDSPKTLEGYRFYVTSSNSYQIQAKCSGGIRLVESKEISGATISMTPNPILFKVLGQGTDLTGDAVVTILQSGTGYTTSVTIGPGGNITQGAVTKTSIPVPTPSAAPTPSLPSCNGVGGNCLYDGDCCSGLECSGGGYCIKSAPAPTPFFSDCNGGYGCQTDQVCDYWSGEQCLYDPMAGQNCCKYP